MCYIIFKDILETLGIEPESESGLHIVRLYLEGAPRESLLACILTALPAVASAPSKPATEPIKDPDNLTYYIEEIRLLLLRARLDKNQLKQLDGVLRRYVCFSPYQLIGNHLKSQGYFRARAESPRFVLTPRKCFGMNIYRFTSFGKVQKKIKKM